MPEWQLETERLSLRYLTPEDADLMLAVWNDPAFICHVGDRGIRTREQALEAMHAGVFKSYAENGFGPYAMVRKDDAARLGICGLFKRDNLEQPDIGFGVLPEFCGKGFASEAAAAVLDYARSELGIHELTAIVSPGNRPSIRLIEKLGLSLAGEITMPGDDDAILLYRGHLGQE